MFRIKVLILFFMILSDFTINLNAENNYSFVISVKEQNYNIYFLKFINGIYKNKKYFEKKFFEFKRKDYNLEKVYSDPRLYNNRYILDNKGNIIDLKTMEIILNQRSVVKIEGNHIILKGIIDYKTNENNMLYDLNNKEIIDLDSDYYFKLNVSNYLYSDDGKKCIVFGMNEFNAIFLYTGNRENKVLVFDKIKNNQLFSKIDHKLIAKTTPKIWYDNDNFLFANTIWHIDDKPVESEDEILNNYNKIRGNITVYRYDTVNDKLIILKEIKNIKPSQGYSSFKTVNDKVYFFPVNNEVTKDSYFLVDIKRNILIEAKIDFYNVDNGFEVQYHSDNNGVRIIKYKKIEIGSKICDEVFTADGYIGFVNDEGLNVWDKWTKTWQIIDIGNQNNISAELGWYME